MELRAYWAIIWRRGWLILLIVAIAALYVGYELYVSHKSNVDNAKIYHSQVTFQLGLVTKNPATPTSYTDKLTAIDTQGDILMESPILQSTAFDTQVSQQIAKDSSAIQQKFGAGADLGSWQDPKAIGDALSVTKIHGIITIATVWSTPAGSWALAQAVGEVSESSIGNYLDYSVEGPANSAATTTAGNAPLFVARVVIPAADPTEAPNPNAPVKNSTLALILVVALVLGIALAFLVDYLDDSIHSKDEIPDLLNVPVYGELPRTSSADQPDATPKKPSIPTSIG